MVEMTENGIIGRVGVAVQEVPARGSLTPAQVQALLMPINGARVLHLDGNSHVSQQDIRAHLIRVFGFGNYDLDVVKTELVFEDSSMRTRKRDGKEYLGWDVCYRALVRLTVRNPDGEYVAHYEDGSTATAQGQPSRGDAHDLAYKSAISLSVKRAAIALGDQFGLSLYNKGQQSALVGGTMVGLPTEQARRAEDVQEGIEQQVSLGNDEVEREPVEDSEPVVNQSTGEVEGATDWAKAAREVPLDAEDAAEQLRSIWEAARNRNELTQAVKSAVLERKQAVDAAPKNPAPTPAEATEEAPAEEPNTTKAGK
ncbi:ssDNA binding protein [Microbacterium phage Gingerbug]|nr:ssDNA binding protein [Microbacterium phage Gingerbug]